MTTSGGFTVDNEPVEEKTSSPFKTAGGFEKSQPTNDRWSWLSTIERIGIYRGERDPQDV